MTVADLYQKNPNRETFPPMSIFLAEDEDGKQHLVCFADLIGPRVIDTMKKIGSWKVIQETVTQEEINRFQFIENLPDPKFKPDRDMVLCQRVEQTIGGIYLPETAEQPSQVARVLAVGDGLLLDCGQVRKSRYKRGDKIFTTPRDGFEMTIDGGKYWVFEACEIVGKFLEESKTAYGAEHC